MTSRGFSYTTSELAVCLCSGPTGPTGARASRVGSVLQVLQVLRVYQLVIVENAELPDVQVNTLRPPFIELGS